MTYIVRYWHKAGWLATKKVTAPNAAAARALVKGEFTCSRISSVTKEA